MATIIYHHDEQFEVILVLDFPNKAYPRYFGMFLGIFNHKINVKSVTVTCLIKMGRDPSGQDHKSSICHVSLSENPKLLILP